MPGLLAVGELPPMSRSRTGRKPGKWRGHEYLADELRTLADKESDPERRWGKIEKEVPEYKAQALVGSIKKGRVLGFEHSANGWFEAKSRKSDDQTGAEIHPKTGKPRVLYDVWARYRPEPPPPVGAKRPRVTKG